jgi:hypothetical protein
MPGMLILSLGLRRLGYFSDILLDLLLNFSNVTVQSCVHENEGICLDLGFIKEVSNCPKCHHFSDDLHRNIKTASSIRCNIFMVLMTLLVWR